MDDFERKKKFGSIGKILFNVQPLQKGSQTSSTGIFLVLDFCPPPPPFIFLPPPPSLNPTPPPPPLSPLGGGGGGGGGGGQGGGGGGAGGGRGGGALWGREGGPEGYHFIWFRMMSRERLARNSVHIVEITENKWDCVEPLYCRPLLNTVDIKIKVIFHQGTENTKKYSVYRLMLNVKCSLICSWFVQLLHGLFHILLCGSWNCSVKI